MTLQICCSVEVVCICAEMENSELESIVKLLPDRAREECEELRKIVEFDAWVVGRELLDRSLIWIEREWKRRREEGEEWLWLASCSIVSRFGEVEEG